MPPLEAWNLALPKLALFCGQQRPTHPRKTLLLVRISDVLLAVISVGF